VEEEATILSWPSPFGNKMRQLGLSFAMGNVATLALGS
jgi:hypothetical protein